MERQPKPPFPADHVGSLLRPPELLQAREDLTAGHISPARLRQIEDDAIRAVVRAQQEIGLHTVTDGEFRRASWHMDFLHQIGGVTTGEDKLRVQFHNERGTIEFAPAALRTNARLHLRHCIFGDHFDFLKSVTRVIPKISIPSPSMMHYRGGQAAIDPRVYPDVEEFWSDLARVYSEEIQQLHVRGCRYLQLDDTSLAYLNDPAQRDYISNLGGNGINQHLTYIRLINRALELKPPDMTVCTHMCRGNFRSSWVASGGYDYVAEALFNELNVDGFFLEYDDARSGGFEPLRFVPKGKVVVLGLVTTKRPTLESTDDLKRRIDQASKYVPLQQLRLSPQCGFSSTVEGNQLSADDQWAKLRLVVETAREIWG